MKAPILTLNLYGLFEGISGSDKILIIHILCDTDEPNSRFELLK